MTSSVKTLLSLSLFAGITLGGLARDDEPATPKSDAKPGKAESSPGTLEVGKYVQGRLGSEGPSKQHYWAIDLEPGKYLVILDSHRSDERESTVGVTATWVGEDRRAAFTNSAFGRDRDAHGLTVEKAGRKVLRVENRSAMAEYQLAVVKADAPFSNTWFLKGPSPKTIKLGESVTTPELDGDSLFGRDAFYLIKLPEGDFKVSAEYKAVGKGTHCGVAVHSLTLAGKQEKSLLSEYGTQKEGRGDVKLITADEGTMLLRVRAKGCKQVTTFKVGKMGE